MKIWRGKKESKILFVGDSISGNVDIARLREATQSKISTARDYSSIDDTEENEVILTGLRLEKSLARKKRNEHLVDNLNWGEREVEADQMDEWEELLSYLVEYSKECMEDEVMKKKIE